MQQGADRGPAESALLDDFRIRIETEGWDRLFALGERLQFRAGEALFSEGESGGRLYRVESGQIDLIADYGGSNEPDLLQYGPHEILGEISFLGPAPFFARAIAATDAIVCWIDRVAFQDAVRQDPELAVAFARLLTERLQGANDRRLAPLRRQYAELAAVQAVGQAMVQSLRLDTVLNALYQEIGRLLDAPDLTVALYDEVSDLWQFPLVIRAGQRISLPDLPLARGPLDYVLMRREPVLLNEHTRRELPQAYRDLSEAGLPAAWLAAPIQTGKQIIGVLAVGSARDQAYDADMIKLLVAIAAQAATAIDNARLYEHANTELAQRVAELAARNQELKALNTLRNDLTDMVVHDLRNPLHVVLTGIGLSLEVAGDDPAATTIRDALSVASDAAKNMIHMINTLLDVSRIEAGHMPLALTPTSVRELVQTVVHRLERMASEMEVTLETSWPTELPIISADRDKIERVLINLVDNALKFTPPGGRIVIAVRPVVAPERGVEVSVTDNGPGIPADQQQHIFDKFGQLRSPAQRVRGSGIGLAFCKLAVEAHGGRIWVVSPVYKSPGRGGAAFHYVLPMTHPPSCSK